MVIRLGGTVSAASRVAQNVMGADLLRFSCKTSLLRTARGQRPLRRSSMVRFPWPSPSASASGGPRRIPKAQALEVPTGSRPVRDGSPGHHTRPFRRWLGRRYGRLRAHTAVLRLNRCPGRFADRFRNRCIDPAFRSGRSGWSVLPTRRCRLSCSPFQPSLLDFRSLPSDPSGPLSLPFRTVWKLPSFR